MTTITLTAGPSAFGNGAHPSTQGALLALEVLTHATTPSTILDIGCGSGILMLASAHHWPNATILGTDIVENAVATANANLAQHALQHRATAYRADGPSHPAIAARAPYDLIIANILAEPLISLADDIASNLAPGGHAILSGILAWRLAPILQAYRLNHLTPTHELALDQWRTLIIPHA